MAGLDVRARRSSRRKPGLSASGRKRGRQGTSRATAGGAALGRAAIAPSPARADDLAALVEPGTVISVGGFSGTGARFQGTRAVGLWGLPYASFRKADAPREWFLPDDAVDVALVDAPAIQAGAVLDVRSGRSLHDDRSLAGLPDARSRSRSACSARSGRWTTSCGSAPRSRGGARA